MGNYYAYRIGVFLAMHLPLKFCYFASAIISSIQYLVCFNDRRIVKDNFKIVFPEKNNWQIRLISWRSYINFGKYLVDFFRFDMIDKDFIEKKLEIVGMDYVKDTIKKGTGVVVVTAHIGNWEFGGVSMGLLGYPFMAIAFPHKDERVNSFFNHQRTSKGVKIVQTGNAAFECLRGLKKNGIVAILGDRDFTNASLMVDFFGKISPMPRGPAAFSIRSSAPIIVGFCVRLKGNNYRLIFEKPIEYTPTHDKEKDLHILTKKYLVVIEEYVRKYPEQWYMFKPFWEPLDEKMLKANPN